MDAYLIFELTAWWLVSVLIVFLIFISNDPLAEYPWGNVLSPLMRTVVLLLAPLVLMLYVLCWIFSGIAISNWLFGKLKVRTIRKKTHEYYPSVIIDHDRF